MATCELLCPEALTLETPSESVKRLLHGTCSCGASAGQVPVNERINIRTGGLQPHCCQKYIKQSFLANQIVQIAVSIPV